MQNTTHFVKILKYMFTSFSVEMFKLFLLFTVSLETALQQAALIDLLFLSAQLFFFGFSEAPT